LFLQEQIKDIIIKKIPCSKVGFGGSHGVSVGWGLLLSNASPTHQETT
jgi:hypothetical protein